MTNKEIATFRSTVRMHFRKQGRSFLWRETSDPYRILVSEVMLQQTQVERVIPKYKEFIERFSTVQGLARASLGEVLTLWSGLGYNRRAKLLHQTAQLLVSKNKGVFPQTKKELEELPGIGHYTAGAVMAFAYNMPIVMIETNIRAVYLHHFFKNKKAVSDADIIPLIEKTLDKKEPRLWYNMLMDYGAWIKKEYGNPNKKSAHHVVQKKFEGSVRQVRGALIRVLAQKPHTLRALGSSLGFQNDLLRKCLCGLEKEHMVVLHKRTWRLP